MIALDPVVAVKAPPEPTKEFRYDLSAAINIELVNREWLEAYRADRQENSKVYTDVRIAISEREIIHLTLEEFIRRVSANH